ncbi:type VI secretion system Vgr family protein [Taylorella equigenitalis]|uniref:VgrG protein n=2 Tax=Taylorella equigenitalis TaxID=29575 RepID=A0A654KH04_TAYEM|nr:type VI secretion system tip protein TssI/VgrG [Taylorella equigenitalis]ADU91665.1 VgrG protein [Taylorella equigenitalis MCE9]ASY37206.1 type VI secretion system tip protein VgrG [Taylorella equigenitalis]ASY41631.1 type VI secretion protein VgrG [Taylorella equigenitalis]KGK33692.1 type VI secretion protein VgrG [Taylorella equigenitalis]RBA27138.1 type VI secretion system tip protein VgrG [Taylorella equigenitalis]
MSNRHVNVDAAVSGLKIYSFKGKEHLSKLFEYEVELVSENGHLDVRDMLGTSLTIEIEMSLLQTRYLNGRVIGFELVGPDPDGSEYYIYKAKVVPNLWFLTKAKDYKIFQEKKAEDIIKEVLDKYSIDYEFKLSGSYRNWEYLVQYEESPFDFISRLMEHEGMYYWFKHEKGSNKLVISDSAEAHEFLIGYQNLNYLKPTFAFMDTNEVISDWSHKAQVSPSKYSVIDFDFRKPSTSLDANNENQLKNDDSVEVYEWQGGYQELSDGDNYAQLRIQELQVSQEIIEAKSNIRGVVPGYKFVLLNHPRLVENNEYLVIGAEYDVVVHAYNTNDERKDKFAINFKCIPMAVQFRAPRTTKIPKTTGPQTATVVGPQGEEIYTDKYGRIKVQFHWDRDGKKDENSSCWIRVSNIWANSGYGGLFIPRIGSEVIVDFIGGNPDRPIVVGCVYNEDYMPLMNLPDEKHTSGIRTRTIQGGSDNQNFLLFRDKQGDELIDVQAERDMNIFVKNDFFLTVG